MALGTTNLSGSKKEYSIPLLLNSNENVAGHLRELAKKIEQEKGSILSFGMEINELPAEYSREWLSSVGKVCTLKVTFIGSDKR